jgi:hypothetical protein
LETAGVGEHLAAARVTVWPYYDAPSVMPFRLVWLNAERVVADCALRSTPAVVHASTSTVSVRGESQCK